MNNFADGRLLAGSVKAVSAIHPLRVWRIWLTLAPLAFSRYRQHLFNLGWLLAGSLLIGVPLFYRGLFGMIVSDHDVHVRIIQCAVEKGVWPAHFLFPAAVYGLSGLSHEFVTLAWSALVLLTACVVAKAWLSYTLLVRHCPRSLTMSEIPFGWSHPTLLVLMTLTMMLAAPVVRPWSTNRVYLGQISPNIWHNPTSILCWPLVIMLFFSAAAFLRSGRLRELVAVGLLAALSVVAKPNYFLAFAPVYCVLALRRFGISRTWLLSQLAMVPTVMLLCWQLTASFDGPGAMRPGLHIAWAPLSAWHIHSHSIPLSVLFSLAFPMSYFFIFRRSLQNRDMLCFAWAVMLSAIVWTSCFAEVRTDDGVVNGDFNFSWGSHLSLFVLFLVTAMDLINNPAAMTAVGRSASAGRMGTVPWWLLGAHAASGALWIVRQIIGRGY